MKRQNLTFVLIIKNDELSPVADTLNLHSHNEHFDAALDLLNEQQAKAVNTIEGPVLVIAGPGTGKTHVLAARIGKILLETDAQAHNILCLTFTDAGVQAMRSRLLKFIGSEAHRVHIYTFHSFCNGVIQDNLELFGRHDLEPVSQLEKIEIVQEILYELPVNHLLKQGRGGDIYYYASHLIDLFKRMKAENWSVSFLGNQIETYIESLPQKEGFYYKRNTKNAKKGDLNVSKFKPEQERMNRLRAGVNLFPKYLEKMKARRRYDYEDMILWVVKAFNENEMLLRTYQEQYLYFLVDEYQDTNGSQNQILQHLIRYWQSPNIFIVGDDDQSIYEFQGARLKNLTDFYAEYEEDMSLIVLRDNYRSTQHILDTSRYLIENNEKRIVNNIQSLGLDKHLMAQNEEVASLSVLPQIVAYPNKLQEETDIVQQIQALEKEGVPLDEIAVIYAKHKQADNLISLLEKNKITYSTKKKINILDLMVIRRLRMLLSYLQAENTLPYSGEDLLFKLLHFDFFEIDLDDLAQISLYRARQKYTERKPWRVLISDKKTLKKLDLNAPDKLYQTGLLFKEFLSDFANLPVPRLVEHLLNKTGLLRLIIDAPEQPQLLQAVYTFVNFVKKETERNPRLTPNDFLETLQSMDKNNISLEIEKLAINTNGVNLLTAHGSKGLEFRYVFILDCSKESWEKGTGNHQYRFKYPDTVTLSGEEDVEEARRRLFYVALTRAKEFVQISYAASDDKGKERQRTLFLDELLQYSELKVEERNTTSEQVNTAQKLLLTTQETPQLKIQSKEILDGLLEDFELSVSAMNKYLTCPVSFYYENVLQVPSVQSEAASYGTAMHNTLQRVFERMLNDKQKYFPLLKECLEIFEREMLDLQGYFKEKTYKQSLKRGREYLKGYYQKYSKTWSRKVLVEKSISTEVESVRIKGVIDRLNFMGSDKATIIDYKTGKQTDKKVKAPTKAEPNGGIYWRQLHFYKILYENFRNTPIRITSGTISYLEPDSTGEYVEEIITYQQKNVDKVLEMLKSVYKSIMNHEFAEGCGEERCNWCRFLNEQKTIESFANTDIESLDDA